MKTIRSVYRHELKCDWLAIKIGCNFIFDKINVHSRPHCNFHTEAPTQMIDFSSQSFHACIFNWHLFPREKKFSKAFFLPSSLVQLVEITWAQKKKYAGAHNFHSIFSFIFFFTHFLFSVTILKYNFPFPLWVERSQHGYADDIVHMVWIGQMALF